MILLQPLLVMMVPLCGVHLTGRVQMNSTPVQTKVALSANESGSSPKEVSLLAVKEQGNVIEFHHYD